MSSKLKMISENQWQLFTQWYPVNDEIMLINKNLDDGYGIKNIRAHRSKQVSHFSVESPERSQSR